jgi:Family of unknown function (DUF6364)
MRTTLTIDDDVLTAAKAMARQTDRSLGEVISELARKALERPSPKGMRNGIPLLVRKSVPEPITMELVNALRDELP